MVGVDSSIYFKQETPDMAGAMQRGMSMGQMFKGKVDQDNIQRAYAAGMSTKDGKPSFDGKATMSLLAQGGYGQQALELNQKLAEQERLAQDQNRQNEEHAFLKKKREIDTISNLLYDVKDQPSYDRARTLAAQQGIDVSKMPRGFDPGLVNHWRMSTLTTQQRMDHSLKERELALKERELIAKRKEPGAGLTEAEKAVDKKYAENYNNFTSKGNVNAEAAIKRLEAIASEMEKDTGFGEAGGTRFEAIIPDALRARDAIRRRDSARNAANTTLKELFGGQLSDGERIAAAKEYYNDALDNKANAALLRDKIQQLKEGLKTETEKTKYYEANRSLRGFKFNNASNEDSSKRAQDKQARTSTPILKTSEIEW